MYSVLLDFTDNSIRVIRKVYLEEESEGKFHQNWN
jgi:hypothetical protein